MAQRLSLPEIRRQAKISEQHSRSRRIENPDAKYSRQFITVTLLGFGVWLVCAAFVIFDNWTG